MPRPSLKLGFRCPLNWDDLHGSGRVRHCEGCDRKIPDLTAFDHRELSAWFSRQKGPICGRFWVDIRTRQIVAPRWEVPNSRIAMVALALTVPIELANAPEPEPAPVSVPEVAEPPTPVQEAHIDLELILERDPFDTQLYTPVLGVPC